MFDFLDGDYGDALSKGVSTVTSAGADYAAAQIRQIATKGDAVPATVPLVPTPKTLPVTLPSSGFVFTTPMKIAAGAVAVLLVFFLVKGRK